MAPSLAAHTAEPPFTFSVLDVPANELLDLRFENHSRRTLCLADYSWPNEAGIIPASSERISISIEGKEYQLHAPIIDPPPLIGAKVKAGQSISAYLKYSAFQIPRPLFAKPKVLHMTPRLVACD